MMMMMILEWWRWRIEYKIRIQIEAAVKDATYEKEILSTQQQ
jgi:hypothetical protein